MDRSPSGLDADAGPACSQPGSVAGSGSIGRVCHSSGVEAAGSLLLGLGAAVGVLAPLAATPDAVAEGSAAPEESVLSGPHPVSAAHAVSAASPAMVLCRLTVLLISAPTLVIGG
ncbi:hypothetical protein [Streptomyces sp. NPDC002054]|uniref:hypothetical protein n=1 Tax=Streptomyces sp. NPDC002054 TaxID=3154663 RepID=UPI0033228B07